MACNNLGSRYVRISGRTSPCGFVHKQATSIEDLLATEVGIRLEHCENLKNCHDLACLEAFRMLHSQGLSLSDLSHPKTFIESSQGQFNIRAA